jgi:hypothetical protein
MKTQFIACVITVNVSMTVIIIFPQERADVEWKFARSKLWISYFEEGGSVPPPFNIIPTPKSVWYFMQWLHRKLCGHSRAAKKEHMRTIRVSFVIIGRKKCIVQELPQICKFLNFVNKGKM